MLGNERGVTGNPKELKDITEVFYSTWFRLREPWPQGKVIGQELAKKLINDPDLHRLALIGPPGAGKTILAQQIKGLLQRFGIDVDLVQFDEFASEQERRLKAAGYSTPHPFQWAEEWKPVAKNMLERAREQYKPFNEGKRRIQILEMPAIGDEEKLDRAITTLDELVKEGNIMVITVAGDPRNQRKSWQMRTNFTNFKINDQGEKYFFNPQTGKMEVFDPRWVKYFLEKVYKTKVVWLFSKKPSTSEEEGEVIIDILSKAAPEKAISLVTGEIRGQVEAMLKEEGKTTRNLPILPSLPPSRPNSRFGKFLAGEYQNYQMSVYYGRKQIQRLINRFGLPKDLGIVVLNPYDDDLVYLYL